ncbi:MAG: hypothetical protein WAX07_05625 [Candidatus Altiarchaeia archaeon]
MSTYKIEHLANWYYGNVCMKCGRMDTEDGGKCFDRLHSMKNELPDEMTHKEYVKYVKNKEGLCKPIKRTFHECEICKALGVPAYRG